MTNLDLMMLAGEVPNGDSDEALDLLEQASALGDAEAAAALLLIDVDAAMLENEPSDRASAARSTTGRTRSRRAPERARHRPVR